jgi:hypothetical protein
MNLKVIVLKKRSHTLPITENCRKCKLTYSDRKQAVFAWGWRQRSMRKSLQRGTKKLLEMVFVVIVSMWWWVHRCMRVLCFKLYTSDMQFVIYLLYFRKATKTIM